MPSNTSEKGLENIIVEYLVNQNGYVQGTSQDYNADYALDTARVETFLCETQPQKVAESLAFASPHNKHQFFERLKNEISKRGVIDVLRKGYRYNTNHFDIYFPLPSELNDTAKQTARTILNRTTSTPCGRQFKRVLFPMVNSV